MIDVLAGLLDLLFVTVSHLLRHDFTYFCSSGNYCLSASLSLSLSLSRFKISKAFILRRYWDPLKWPCFGSPPIHQSNRTRRRAFQTEKTHGETETETETEAETGIFFPRICFIITAPVIISTLPFLPFTSLASSSVSKSKEHKNGCRGSVLECECTDLVEEKA